MVGSLGWWATQLPTGFHGPRGTREHAPGHPAPTPTGLSPSRTPHSNGLRYGHGTAGGLQWETPCVFHNPWALRPLPLDKRPRLDWSRFARRYYGIRVCFLDPGTKMFQFPGLAPPSLTDGRALLPEGGFPHSVTLGSLRATPLPEAFRGVPRPSSPHPHPRHPPCAFVSVVL